MSVAETRVRRKRSLEDTNKKPNDSKATSLDDIIKREIEQALSRHCILHCPESIRVTGVLQANVDR